MPTTIQTKSRANPVLRLCFPLALIDDDFLSKGCLCISPVLCFFTNCIGCSAALSWDNTIWNFSTSVLSFFTRLSETRATSVLSFFIRLSDTRDRRLASEIQLSTLVAVDRTDFFRQCSEKVHENTQKTSSARNRIQATPPFRLLSTGPYVHCVTVHSLASSQRSVTSPRKGTTSFSSTKTERAVQGSPHNACIL